VSKVLRLLLLSSSAIAESSGTTIGCLTWKFLNWSLYNKVPVLLLGYSFKYTIRLLVEAVYSSKIAHWSSDKALAQVPSAVL